MLISYIEKIGRSKVRVSLEDGDSFLISEREWNRWDLNVGDDMDEDVQQKLYGGWLLPKAKMKALNLLKVRDRSYRELIQKLKIEGYPDSIIQETIQYVDAYHYMDDTRYAQNYIEYRGKKKSRKELEYELEARGIDLGTLRAGKNDLKLPDDQETIKAILLKKWGENPTPDSKEKERMIRYLARRGFGVNDILTVYKELFI